MRGGSRSQPHLTQGQLEAPGGQVWDWLWGRIREHGCCRDELKAQVSCWEACPGGRGSQEEHGSVRDQTTGSRT